MFQIDDPEGKKKRLFERAVGARRRKLRSQLVSRFIKKEKAPKEGNPNANKKPWELYGSFITKEQWERFEAYVGTKEFKVTP